jgi:hypothetical protein
MQELAEKSRENPAQWLARHEWSWLRAFKREKGVMIYEMSAR